MKKQVVFGGAMVGLAMGGNAMAAITMEKDVDNTPFVLIGGSGSQPVAMQRLSITNDGEVINHSNVSSWIETRVLKYDLKLRNDASSGNSQFSVSTGNPTRDMYSGSVNVGTATTNYSSFGQGGVSRALPDGSMFSWMNGNPPTVSQVQFQKADGTYGIQQATRSGVLYSVAPMAMQYRTAFTATGIGATTTNRRELDYVSTVNEGGTDYYQMLGAGNPGAADPLDPAYGILKFRFSHGTAGTSTSPGTLNATVGTASTYLTGGSLSTKKSLLDDLVPSTADDILGMALDPVLHAGKNRLYFVSITGRANDSSTNGYVFSDNKVYLSAVEFTYGDLTADSSATYVDLDTGSANNYQEIQWAKPGQADGTASGNSDSLLTVNDLVFSPDASKLYVSNGSKRVFIFNTAPIPEPSSLAMLGLGSLALLRRKRKPLPA